MHTSGSDNSMRSMKSTAVRIPSVFAISRSDRGPGAVLRTAPGLLALLFVAAACQYNEEQVLSAPDDAGREIPWVTAAAETAAVASKDDAADDSVVIVADGRAWIAGTDKQFGLRI